MKQQDRYDNETTVTITDNQIELQSTFDVSSKGYNFKVEYKIPKDQELCSKITVQDGKKNIFEKVFNIFKN